MVVLLWSIVVENTQRQRKLNRNKIIKQQIYIILKKHNLVRAGGRIKNTKTKRCLQQMFQIVIPF